VPSPNAAEATRNARRRGCLLITGFSSSEVFGFFDVGVRGRAKYAARPARTSSLAVLGAIAVKCSTEATTCLRTSGSWLSVAKYRYVDPICILDMDERQGKKKFSDVTVPSISEYEP
jgi:hypothetical protein